MSLKKQIIDWWAGANFGLLSQLLGQSGNGGTGLKIRMIFNGITSGGEYQGSYSAASTYAAADIIGYPSDTAPLRYRANQSTTAGQSPDTNPEKWDLEVGLDVIQDIGSSKYARYLLGIRNDDMVRLNGIERGAFATSAFTRRSTYYDVTAGGTTTSVTSMAIPSSHPTSRTLTVGTGLSFPDSSTLSGTCTDSFAIPTTHPTLAARNLPAGLGLSTGDLVVMYGDASNFFGYVIARYNNATGVAYGASSFHVGTGTFSSWTLKSERLIYIERTADTVGKNLYALVQSYDSGTGSLTFNTVNNTGATTNSDWTVYLFSKRPNPVPGTNSARYNGNQLNNAFGTYGLWHVITWSGNRLLHRSTKATNGTGWIYVYGSGDEAVTPSDIEIDTYNGSTITDQETTTFSDLTSGSHTVIAFSKVSASGSSTNTRPYIDAGTTTPNYSFREQYEYDVFTADITAGASGAESFGEIAYKFRDTDGGDTTQWVPEHSNVKTTTGRNRTFTIDGVVADHTDENDPYMLKYVDFSTASLVQSLSIVHPQATGDMGTMAVTHSFNSQGLYYRVAITWAQAGLIETGYNNMSFLGHAWFNKVLCQDLQVITRPADNTSVNLTATEKDQGSYLFYSTGADPLDKFVLAQYWPNPTRDWRIGGSNLGTPFIQDFSGSANAKWYPFVYSGYSFAADEVITVECRLYAGNKGSLVLS